MNRRRYYRRHYGGRYAGARTFGVYGEIDQHLRQAFFELPRPRLDRVFTIFGQRYGASAERYARSSFSSWASGAKAMAPQTLHRLLESVPEVLPFEGKVAVYAKLREKHRHKEAVRLELRSADDLRMVEEAAFRIADRAQHQVVPSYLEDQLSWLSQGDGALAKEVLAAAEADEGRAVAMAVRRELQDLGQRLRNADLPAHAEHVIRLPCGTITVILKTKVRRGHVNQRSSQDEDQLVRNLVVPSSDPVVRHLESALARLEEMPPEVQAAYQQKLLDLSARHLEGRISGAQASRDMDDFMKQAEEATRGGGNVRMEGTFERRSGTTRITVQKSFWMHAWFWIALASILVLASFFTFVAVLLMRR